MIFLRKDNEFVADVKLRETDMRGTPCVQLTNAGPISCAILPRRKISHHGTVPGLVRDTRSNA